MAFEGQVGVGYKGMREKVESVAKHGGVEHPGVVCEAWCVEDERVREKGDGAWPFD